jgi:beta-phosphoglucomutase-like phosphatase (HAD superfamily)
MINPSDVNLIIFDMDGTIVPSLPAQARYLKEYAPEKTADMVVDNGNWEYPRIKTK